MAIVMVAWDIAHVYVMEILYMYFRYIWDSELELFIYHLLYSDPYTLQANAECEFKPDAISKFVVNLPRLCTGVTLLPNRKMLALSEDSKQILEIKLPDALVFP